MKPKDEAKAREILAAAIAAVAEHGIAGVSMESVARRAGVGTGTLYVYHASKEALIEAAYLSIKRELAATVFVDDGLPLRPAFLRMAGAYFDYAVEHRAEAVFVEQVRYSAFLSDRARAAGDQEAGVMIALLERGKREGLLKPLATTVMISFLHGALRELAWSMGRASARQSAELRDRLAILCWDALRL